MNTEKTFSASELLQMGHFRDGRWHPNEEFAAFFSRMRKPSKSNPCGYYRAATSAKFYRWVEENTSVELDG